MKNDPASDPKDAARRARRFAIAASAAVLFILVFIAAFARLNLFGAGLHANLALFLGVAGTLGLGVGLMALSFYSNRSGADDAVRGMGEDDRTR
jgi:hypothetical protein